MPLQQIAAEMQYVPPQQIAEEMQSAGGPGIGLGLAKFYTAEDTGRAMLERW
jgi:hypothetical protein